MNKRIIYFHEWTVILASNHLMTKFSDLGFRCWILRQSFNPIPLLEIWQGDEDLRQDVIITIGLLPISKDVG